MQCINNYFNIKIRTIKRMINNLWKKLSNNKVMTSSQKSGRSKNSQLKPNQIKYRSKVNQHIPKKKRNQRKNNKKKPNTLLIIKNVDQVPLLFRKGK